MSGIITPAAAFEKVARASGPCLLANLKIMAWKTMPPREGNEQ